MTHTDYKITNTLQSKNIVYRLKIIQKEQNYQLTGFLETQKKKNLHGEIEL